MGRPALPAYAMTVRESFDVAPRMRRVVLGFEAGAAFEYRPGQAVVMMIPLGDGTSGRRDYTIRGAEGDTITIDILKHGDTPGPAWAMAAKPGDRIEIKGPRGRTVLDEDADWHLMTGDETCIPAIAHMLERAPAGIRVHAFIEVASPADRIAIDTGASLDLTWIDRAGQPATPSELMAEAVARFTLPEGRGRAYLIGETGNVRRQRQNLIARGMARSDILSEGYWRPGRIGGHDHVDD